MNFHVLVDLCGESPSDGYISPGFYGGTCSRTKCLSSPHYIEGSMVGRIVLLWMNKLAGDKRVIYFNGNLPWDTICVCI